MNKDYFIKRLAFSQPSAQDSCNYDLLPETFKAKDKIPIECYRHGVFHQRAATHLLGSGCPACGQLKCAAGRALTTGEFIELSRTKFGERFGYEKTVYERKEIGLTLTCPIHGDISVTPDQHLYSKFGCLACGIEMPRATNKKKMLEKARKVHRSRYDYSRVDFINVSSKVEIICPDHGSFWQDLYAHVVRENGCPQCARNSTRLSVDDFVYKSIAIHGNLYDYSKVAFNVTADIVTIGCNKHGEFRQRVASHLAGCKCRKCFRDESLLSTEEFTRNARQVHGERYDYSKVKYHGNKRHVEIICPDHGSFWQTPNTHVSSRQGCLFCQESKGEKAVEVFLKKYGIAFIREYRIVPHLFRYDFYLPEYDIFIEFNGKQHYQPVELFGGVEAYLKTKERDEIKKRLVREQGGKLIVLTYLNLRDNSVDKELINRLKRVYRHWYVVKGKLVVFRKTMDVYTAFGVDTSVAFRDLDALLAKTIDEFSVLF